MKSKFKTISIVFAMIAAAVIVISINKTEESLTRHELLKANDCYEHAKRDGAYYVEINGGDLCQSIAFGKDGDFDFMKEGEE